GSDPDHSAAFAVAPVTIRNDPARPCLPALQTRGVPLRTARGRRHRLDRKSACRSGFLSSHMADRGRSALLFIRLAARTCFAAIFIYIGLCGSLFVGGSDGNARLGAGDMAFSHTKGEIFA